VTETAVEHAEAETKLPPQVRNALLALIVGGIAAILDSTMLTLALHTLVVRLHSSDGTIQWITTSYLLAMTVAIPTTGWAESRWGGKRVWMAALVLFVLGSVLCALAWSDMSLIGFRVLQGFAAGLIFPLMQTLGVKAAGGHASPNLIATVSLPLALGPILGPVIGGVIDPQLAELAVAVPGQRAGDRDRASAGLAAAAPRPPRYRRRARAPGCDRARAARPGARHDSARPVERLRGTAGSTTPLCSSRY
jgi:MFS family permease